MDLSGLEWAVLVCREAGWTKDLSVVGWAGTRLGSSLDFSTISGTGLGGGGRDSDMALGGGAVTDWARRREVGGSCGTRWLGARGSRVGECGAVAGAGCGNRIGMAMLETLAAVVGLCPSVSDICPGSRCSCRCRSFSSIRSARVGPFGTGNTGVVGTGA